MAAESFFDRQQALRRLTRVLLLLTALGALGSAMVGGLLTLMVYAHAESSDPAVVAWTNAHHAFLAGAVAMVGLIALVALVHWAIYRHRGRAMRGIFGARRIDGAGSSLSLAERQLVNVVEEMALAASVPVPDVYLTDDAAINSFALVTADDESAVGVSAGALEALSRAELQAMVAHEIAHIHNGDARINLALLSLSRGFSSIYDFGSAVIGYPLRRFGSNGFVLMLTYYLAMVFAIFFVVGAVGRLTSRLLQAAVARQREYLADAAALQFLRQAAPLVSALEKAGRCRVDKPNRPARQAAFMMFVSPHRDRFWLVRTHPKVERRIAAVHRMTPQPDVR
ncbi:MAG TPA: M48 family metalloprotease [Hyphomicrobium sp.]|nr:M48 family metalloprotease [Hyphomicrobium sp.]